MSDPEIRSLEDKINASGGALSMLRSSNDSTVIFPGIPPEFTNWRDEQRAWHHSVVLFEQSFHMTELHIRGADALAFVSQFATNDLSNLTPLRAKQLIMVDPSGHLVSDAIIFCESSDFLRIVGPPTASNWLQFNSESSDMAIEVTRNENMIIPRERRDVFRFQLQGPNALDLMRAVVDDGLPEIKFFRIGEFKIAGHTVRALRHGMAGRPGFELYGPWGKQIRDVQSGIGFRHMSTMNVHFGIGEATEIDSVLVKWPSGIIDVIQTPAINESIIMVEGTNQLSLLEEDGKSVILFPNPTTEVLYAENLDVLNMTRIYVVSQLGQVVMEGATNTNEFDVAHLEEGLYFFIVETTDGKKYGQSFVKK